jgi:hypothetical protein
MKALVITLLFCIAAITSQAQWTGQHKSTQKHLLYTTGDYIVGETSGGNLGINYIYDNKYTLNIGYSASSKGETTLPDEILKSANEMTSINNDQPFENFENLYVMVGRSFSITKNGMRILLQGGPGIANYREPVYNISGSAYSHQTQTTKKLSFTLNPKIEVPIGCNLGVSAGPMLVVNNAQKYFGIGIGVMYGVVRCND